MKRIIGFAYLAFVVLALIQIFGPRLVAQDRIGNSSSQPRNGVCFYMDANYRGEKFCVDAGEGPGNVESRNNDRISSIRVFGGAQVTVFSNGSFSGASSTYTSDTPHLGDWNDKITSFRVAGNRRSGGQRRPR